MWVFLISDFVLFGKKAPADPLTGRRWWRWREDKKTWKTEEEDVLRAVADVRGAVGRVVEAVGLAPGGHGGVAGPGARGHAALLGRPLALVHHHILLL